MIQLTLALRSQFAKVIKAAHDSRGRWRIMSIVLDRLRCVLHGVLS